MRLLGGLAAAVAGAQVHARASGPSRPTMRSWPRRQSRGQASRRPAWPDGAPLQHALNLEVLALPTRGGWGVCLECLCVRACVRACVRVHGVRTPGVRSRSMRACARARACIASCACFRPAPWLLRASRVHENLATPARAGRSPRQTSMEVGGEVFRRSPTLTCLRGCLRAFAARWTLPSRSSCFALARERQHQEPTAHKVAQRKRQRMHATIQPHAMVALGKALRKPA
jgi:hypothetical protein